MTPETKSEHSLYYKLRLKGINGGKDWNPDWVFLSREEAVKEARFYDEFFETEHAHDNDRMRWYDVTIRVFPYRPEGVLIHEHAIANSQADCCQYPRITNPSAMADFETETKPTLSVKERVKQYLNKNN